MSQESVNLRLDGLVFRIWHHLSARTKASPSQQCLSKCRILRSHAFEKGPEQILNRRKLLISKGDLRLRELRLFRSRIVGLGTAGLGRHVRSKCKSPPGENRLAGLSCSVTRMLCCCGPGANPAQGGYFARVANPPMAFLHPRQSVFYT